jgi:exodeoxyribonuclease VII small subunit
VTEGQSPTFEAALSRLEEIVQKLEKGELALEESLVLYEEGVRLSGVCHAKLEEAEGKIEILLKDQRGGVVKDREGQPRTQPFTPSPHGNPGQAKPEGDASS